MGVLRYGDPTNPKDKKIILNMLFDLDMITTSWSEAFRREAQLQQADKMVDVKPRFALPEESHEHLDSGEPTKVWEVWVRRSPPKIRKMYRLRKNGKPKAMITTDKVNKIGKDYLKGVVGLTTAAMTLGLGMGLIGGVGAAVLRKKGKNSLKKRKMNKCGCKK
jgi:hypothetical protein